MYSALKTYFNPLSVREKFINALAAGCAIYVLGLILTVMPHKNFIITLVASMGASSFLLFVVPHSPMVQPWPMIGGHLVSAIVAILVSHTIQDPVIGCACTVAASLFAMQVCNCLHPPGAATALAVFGGLIPLSLNPMFVIYIVMANAFTLLFLAFAINNLVLRRQYPMWKEQHSSAQKLRRQHAHNKMYLEVADVEWALAKMDGVIDVSEEDLIDIYELALEHSLQRKQGTGR